MEVILEQLKIRTADFAKIISNLSLNVLYREIRVYKTSPGG